MKIYPKTIKFEGYKIKEPVFIDVVTLNKKVIETHFLRSNTERDPKPVEMIDRLRRYILNNSKPKLDINTLKPSLATKLSKILIKAMM